LPLIEGVVLPEKIGEDIKEGEMAGPFRAQKGLNSTGVGEIRADEFDYPVQSADKVDLGMAKADVPKKVILEQGDGDEIMHMPGQRSVKQEEDGFLDDSVESLWGFKSQALIGLGGQEKKARGKEKAEEIKPQTREEPDDEGDLEEIINEISGFPSFKTKKKGQKRLDEYDGWGIDYI
jgi:hypothetical protein